MTWVNPFLPPNWVLLGRIPDKEPDEMSLVEAVTYLRPEVCSLSSPRGEFIVSVRWAPEFNGQIIPRPGRYVCTVVRERRWDQPTEEWRFPRTRQVQEWFVGRLKYAVRVMGQV